ncbi:MAG: hypothetical protein NTY22_01630 [Proteobacteria bacterium]|nr:hypothetical protein [Pseudomonadota bacterium]
MMEADRREILTSTLVSIFNIQEDKRYERLTPLNDYVGFTVQRVYPDDLRYKPPKNQNNKPDVVALIHVILRNIDSEDRKTPVFIRISKYSRYISEHFDYVYNDKDSPTKESLELSKKTPHPIDLEITNEFFINLEQKEITDKNNKIKSGANLLDFAFDYHISTVRGFKGLKSRFSKKYKQIQSSSIYKTIDFLKFILRKLFGRYLDDSNHSSYMIIGYPKESIKKLDIDSIVIFNYKASKPVIIFFCILSILFFTAYYYLRQFGYHSLYLTMLTKNNFMMLTTSILALYVLDEKLPYALLWIINFLISTRWKGLSR